MPAQITALNSATFTWAEDVNSWCQTRLGDHFIPWFNRNVAGQGPWIRENGGRVDVVDTLANRMGFHAFWNNIAILTGTTATPLQFLALMGIFANECRADFKPTTERMGRTGFPGMSYLFEPIRGVKRGYNTLAGNKTAYACFRSAAYVAAHREKALGARLANTTDLRWNGDAYPRADFPTSPDPAVSGFITEADFMKFRGRGFIQTTGRPNYLLLIQFVQQYDSENNVLDFYADRWRGQTADQVADASSNEDWDRLFLETDLILAAHAVALHSKGSGNYLALQGDPDAAIRTMGRRISGSDGYAAKYRDRMEFLVNRILA